MKKETIQEATCDVVQQKQLADLEKFADRLLAKFDIDVEFTRHFGDRMGDDRNNPCIKIAELQKLFKKIAKDKGAKVKAHKNSEAVLKDLQSDLNLPFVLNVKPDGEFELVAKTIMRKKNFATSNPEVKYEHAEIEEGVMDTIGLQSPVSKLLNKKSYKHAAKTLQSIVDRKREAGQMKHDVIYYAAQVAKSYNRYLDPKELAKLIK